MNNNSYLDENGEDVPWSIWGGKQLCEASITQRPQTILECLQIYPISASQLISHPWHS